MPRAGPRGKKETLSECSYTIYNAKHYQLTHLLEFGHVIAKTGKRSVARPHIAAVNEAVAQQFVKEVEGMKL